MTNTYIQDAGHGGKDSGASFNGHIEKVYTLEAAAYVNRRLNALGIKSKMTRTTDTYIDSTPRTNIVKKSGAQICLSHHYNAGGGDGAETIHSIHSNGKLATLLAKSIAAAGVKFRRVFSRKGTSGDYYYMHRLTGSVQTVIVEYEFLDGPNNTEIKDKSFRENLYEATVKAVCEYEKIAYVAPGTIVSTPAKKEVDEMAKLLPKTQQDDMRTLLKRAYDTKVFAVNHVGKVNTMTRGQATDLMISYVARIK